jgi:signal transduction histidine kinase
MVLSQLLLVCFMAYWLHTEYSSEEEKLKKDMAVKLERAQAGISDSLVMHRIIRPLVRDSLRKPQLVDLTISDDSDATMFRHIQQKIDSINGKRTRRTEKKVFYYKREVSEEDVMQGMRLMLRTFEELPPGLEEELIRTDTAALAKAFRNEMHKEGIDIRAQWLRSSLPSGRGIYLSIFASRSYQLFITGYSYYLTRQLLPESLFTLLLLSLTALAFIVTYRSLRAQMQLATIRNDFISNMSHELKTPVSTVKVALEAMGEPEVLNDQATAQEYIRMASMEVSRLELLINQTLQTSLLEGGNMQLQTEVLDLRYLVESLAAMMQPRFAMRGGHITTDHEGHSFSLSADKLQIQGVIVNILDNALKYAGEPPVVQITMREEGDRITVALRDHGPGIPAAYAGRVFDKFFRVPKGNEHSVKGYGLGLSYAAQVMKAHGGSIALEATPGGGCTFVLHFNRQPE